MGGEGGEGGEGLREERGGFEREVGGEAVEEVIGLVKGDVAGVGPDLDEALERVVGGEVCGGEELHGGGAGVVAGVEPALDAGAVVGDAGGEADGGFHDVEGDGAAEMRGHCEVGIVVHHHC